MNTNESFITLNEAVASGDTDTADSICLRFKRWFEIGGSKPEGFTSRWESDEAATEYYETFMAGNTLEPGTTVTLYQVTRGECKTFTAKQTAKRLTVKRGETHTSHLQDMFEANAGGWYLTRKDAILWYRKSQMAQLGKLEAQVAFLQEAMTTPIE